MILPRQGSNMILGKGGLRQPTPSLLPGVDNIENLIFIYSLLFTPYS